MSASRFTSVEVTERVSQALAAALPEHLVRKQEMDILASGLPQLGHTHALSEIYNFDTQLPYKMRIVLIDSASLTFTHDTELGVISGTVRLKESGGLELTPYGVAASFGSGIDNVARGNHSHAQLHDAATVADSVTVVMAIDGQEIVAAVRRSATGGLKEAADGLANDWGSGVNNVARGNHSHTELHNPVTVGETATISLSISGDQALTASVRTTEDAGADRCAVQAGVIGLYVPLGSGVQQCAPGDHSHRVVDYNEDGFMSVADKFRLDALASGVLQESIVSFVRQDSGLQVGQYVGGRVTLPYRFRITEVNLTARAPKLPQWVTLEVGGVQTSQRLLISGTWPDEMLLTTDLSYDVNLDGDRTPGLRWLCNSGVQVTPEDGAKVITINIGVRPR